MSARSCRQEEAASCWLDGCLADCLIAVRLLTVRPAGRWMCSPADDCFSQLPACLLLSAQLQPGNPHGVDTLQTLLEGVRFVLCAPLSGLEVRSRSRAPCTMWAAGAV